MQFKPMLAATINDTSMLQYPLIVSPKLDGIRAMIQDGVVVSRNLKPIPNEYVQDTIGFADPIYQGLDGELIVGSPTAKDCFNVTSSGIMSKAGEPEYRFYVFDIFAKNVGFEKRFEYLSGQVEKANHAFIELVPHMRCHDERSLRVAESKFLADGYEGLMIRSIDGQYKEGRSTAKQGWLLKLKQFVDAEAEVIGIEEQLHNGNTAIKNALGQLERSSKKEGLVGKNTLGALKVRGINGTFKGVEFSIGTGFDDQQRHDIWADKDLIGKVVTFKYFPIGCVEAPRFPVFLRFRNDL